jgi:hypothetical protein
VWSSGNGQVGVVSWAWQRQCVLVQQNMTHESICAPSQVWGGGGGAHSSRANRDASVMGSEADVRFAWYSVPD